LRSIRVETSSATILLTEAPEKKVKDRKSGEVATDGPVGNQLHRQGVRSRSSEGAWSSKTHYLFPDGPDAVSGETLWTIGVVYIEEGESSLIKVTVPERGVSDGLVVGAPVSLPGLVARPWESTFNGQQRHGIAFRAAAVAPGVILAAAEVA
jgi:hypothetical protein